MKNVLSLNGSWQLAGFDEGQGNWAQPESLLPSGAIKAEGHVPGEVHPDLLRAGLIPDPFYGTNVNEVQWVEEKEWWYKRTIEVDDDFFLTRTFLEFDGLDTYATVYLNGQEIGKTDNMFIPHRFDVTDLISVGRNTVAVRFEPAAKLLERIDYSKYEAAFDTPRVNGRKMQCAFGWDWAQRFVGAGIWRGARLVSYDIVSIANVHIEPEISGGSANAWITIEVENNTREDQRVTASVVVAQGENRETIEVIEDVSPFGGIIEAVIRIEEPQLWWPNGFGEQPLYACMVGLQVDGEVQDVSEEEFGVRAVEIIQRDEQDKDVFTVLINGEKIFCKGANWVPADHFPSNISEDRYRELIQLAKDANFNMLRIWGGGIYEDPAFYTACDEMGIMVWQDFMFSCATYPDSEEFCAKVAEEAEVAVKQLRNHPSVVIWCGNNECEMSIPHDQEWSGKKLFHEVIPNVLRKLDKTRPYRPCCPYDGKTGNDPSVGDWHGGGWFDTYLGDVSKWREIIEAERGLFISEFYTVGAPDAESLRGFIPEDKLMPPDGEVWECHDRDNPYSGRTDGKTNQQIMVDLTRRMMGDFEDIEHFAAYSGILQGEFTRAEIEHYRREKWNISGALFWMYNDCWPAVSWSLVDYYMRPKPSYYYVKRAFAPVIISFKPVGERLQLYVTSDRRTKSIDGTLVLGVFTFDACGFEPREIPVKLAPNSSGSFWETPPLDQLFVDPTRQCLVATLNEKDRTIASNVYFPRTFGEMEFPRPKLLVQREHIDDTRHRLAISADSYARNVAIHNLPATARPSDNFFDLLPGEIHEVTIEGINPEQAKALKINVWRR